MVSWNWQEYSLREQLYKIHHFSMDDIGRLDQYDTATAEKVLGILLEWACYGQNDTGILLGRRKIAEIPGQWLQEHLMQVVKYGFDYHDDWNYRRLLELVLDLVPALKEDVLSLNAGTDSQYLLDVMNDFE